MIKRVSILLLFISSISFASAYIDPGMGVAVGSTLWAYLASFFAIVVAFLTKIFINPIKRFFSSLKR